MHHKLMFLFSFLFLTAIGNAVLSLQLSNYEETKFKWIQHTHTVMIKTEQLFSYMKSAETGQREYLLTKQSVHLGPYHKGMTQAKQSLRVLEALSNANSLQLAKLQKVKAVMDLAFQQLAQNIRLIDTSGGDVSAVIELMNLGKDKQYLDQILALLDEFTQTEKVLLQEREKEFENHRIFILAAIIAEIMFFIILAFITILFLNKNLFFPLRLLISNMQKMEDGIKVEVTDVKANHEMGYLLAKFFKLYGKIEERTEQLTYTASHDELTGLNNRVNLYKEIERAIKNLRESSINFAVLYLDLDKFKLLNDSLGHDAGDFILKETATHLEHAVRSQDIVFRVGGDEFVILMNNVKRVDDLHRIAEKLLKTCAEPIIYQEHTLQINFSIGIAMSSPELIDSEQIVNFADIAMYEAKHDKTTRYKFFKSNMLKRRSDKKTPQN